MVLRSIQPLNEEDMFEFLSLFPEQKIRGIDLKLYNGTSSRIHELPSGAILTMDELSLHSKSVKDLREDIQKIDHNQVHTCSVYIRDDKHSCTVFLSLLTLEMSFHDCPELVSMDKMIAFARKKGLEKFTVKFY